VSPGCVIVESVTEEASTVTASDQKQQRRNIVVYDRRTGCQLWEDSLEVGVMLREADHSWYLLRSEGLYSLIVGQTQERILHNLIMGGENVHTSCRTR